MASIDTELNANLHFILHATVCHARCCDPLVAASRRNGEGLSCQVPFSEKSFVLFCTRLSAARVAAIHLCSRDLESLHFSIQPFGAPAAPAGLGPPRVLMLMLMVIVVVVRSHALGRYCFLLHQLASRSVLALQHPSWLRPAGALAALASIPMAAAWPPK